MAKRSVLFNTEMVKAVLEGRKTQTRRVNKPPKGYPVGFYQRFAREWVRVIENFWQPYEDSERKVITRSKVKCPYGQSGDLLWVREMWRVWSWHEGEPITIQYQDGKTREETSDGYESGIEDWYERMWIQSAEDCEKDGIKLNEDSDIYEIGDQPFPTRWRPSIHMPRWVSRITLRVKDVRVERVQEITLDNIIAEGAPFHRDETLAHDHARIWFAELWDSINAKRGFGWEENPWVWVVEFEVVK